MYLKGRAKKWPSFNLRCCPDMSLKGQKMSLPSQTDRYTCTEFEAKNSQIKARVCF